MHTYSAVSNPLTNTPDSYQYTEGSYLICIPKDINNTEYQQMLLATGEHGSDVWSTPIPDDVQTAAEEYYLAWYANQYIWAVNRLAQMELSVGQPEIIEPCDTGETYRDPATGDLVPVYEDRIVQYYVEALPETIEVEEFAEDGTVTVVTVPNPPVVKDEAQRAEAQAIIDNTPQAVKDAVDN